MSEETGKVVAKVDQPQPIAQVIKAEDYKRIRFELAELFEKYTSDKADALELVERYEKGMWAAFHVVAPDSGQMRLGFAVAAQKFLEG